MKKKIRLLTFVICIWMIIGFNIEAMAANNALAIQVNDDFGELIKIIIEIKSKNPEKGNEEIETLIVRQVSLRRDSGVSNIWNSLTDTEKKLVIRYPLDALKVNTAKNIATTQTEKKFGYNGLGDRSDAFRHGMWNAEMVILIGSEKAEMFATAHEDKDITGLEVDGHTKLEHKNMDIHNNAEGRIIGENNKTASEEQLAEIIYNAVYDENTNFIWLNN